MKIAIVGSRCLTIENLEAYFPEGMEIDEIISGGAKGIDSCAKRYACDNQIPYTEILPDYKKYGRGAPIIRNHRIVDAADHVLIFWDKESRGTKSVINYCSKIHKLCTVYEISTAGSKA